MKIDSIVDMFIAATVIPIIVIYATAVTAIVIWSIVYAFRRFTKD